MVENKVWYGVLSSGTRTYFCSIQLVNGNYQAFVSNAYFVGGPNYLRSWTYVIQQSKTTRSTKEGVEQDVITNWKKIVIQQQAPKRMRKTYPPYPRWAGYPRRTPKPKRPVQSDPEDEEYDISDYDHNGSETTDTEVDSLSEFDTADGTPSALLRWYSNPPPGRKMSYSAALCTSVPYLGHRQLTFTGVIGGGRNGSAFLSHFNGEDVAVKQFDLDTGGDKPLHSEIEAYRRIRQVWGELVPVPKFVANSFTGGIIFLGLQLGRDPKHDLNHKELRKVLKTLEMKFGVVHKDASYGRNDVILPGKNPDEKGCLVAIDFEDVHFVAYKLE